MELRRFDNQQAIVDHAIYPDFWRHNPPKIGRCWVCDEETHWIYLDIAYQHVDCDMYPSDEISMGPADVKIIKGERVAT